MITDRDFTIATLVAPSALKKAEGDTTQEGETAADDVPATEQDAEEEAEGEGEGGED